MSMSKSSLPAATTSSRLTFATFATFATRLLRLAPLASAAFVALPLGMVCASCLNPQNDYDQYVDRAADASVPNVPMNEASTIDVASLNAPDASFDQKKLAMICISELGQDISEALLWVVELKYDKNDGGSAGGMLTYSSYSLAAHSTDVNSPLPGTQITGLMGAIDSHGAGTIHIASATLPAAANGIGGTAVGLSNVVEEYHVESPTQICASLGSQVMTMGTTLTLVPDQNPCIFLPTDKNGQWGPVTTDQVHCP